MVVGFNHNIRYKGEMFHVQTEDSGRANPHIITLLYRGGTILGSIKTSYADILMAEQLELVVESIMKEQHKDMMRRLKNGEYDARIFGTAQAPAAEAQESTPVAVQQAKPAQAAAQQTTPAPAPAAAPKPAAPTAPAPTATPAATSTQAVPAATPIAAPRAAAPAAAAPATPQAPPAATRVAAPAPAAPAPAAPAAPSQASRTESSPLAGGSAAAVRQASAAALATALHRQQPTPKETPAPASGAASASISKRSLDEVILDYLITGEE